MRAFFVLVAFSSVFATMRAGAQDAEAQDAETQAAAPQAEPDDEARLPPLESPTTIAPEEEEPSIAEIEEAMVPTLELPEFRIRAGGGISLATSGSQVVWGRSTQEIEWMPASLEFLAFGLAAAETIGVQTIVQFGARLGGYAWLMKERDLAVQAVINIQLGASAGGYGWNFDFAADVDLRLLLERIVEFHVRGGFFSIGTTSFVNITAGAAIAF